MHTVRKTNEQIIWEEKHLLRQLKFFAKSHNESKKCIITAIDQWTLSRIHRQLEGPANPKGAYHYPPWSGDSNSTIRVVQKSLVFANTLANLKMATLNYIFRWVYVTVTIRLFTVHAFERPPLPLSSVRTICTTPNLQQAYSNQNE